LAIPPLLPSNIRQVGRPYDAFIIRRLTYNHEEMALIDSHQRMDSTPILVGSIWLDQSSQQQLGFVTHFRMPEPNVEPVIIMKKHFPAIKGFGRPHMVQRDRSCLQTGGQADHQEGCRVG
jgi:hypothetical protein